MYYNSIRLQNTLQVKISVIFFRKTEMFIEYFPYRALLDPNYVQNVRNLTIFARRSTKTQGGLIKDPVVVPDEGLVRGLIEGNDALID